MNMTNLPMLLRCPSCETPFEYGEELCSACHSPLPHGCPPDDDTPGDDQRRRSTRIVTWGTTVVYATALLGMFLAQAPIWAGITTGTSRDLIYLIELSVIIIAGLAVYGTPGRTLHHYPSAALIRRGTPRWWKGAAASAVLVCSTAIAFEGLQRPALERRGSRAIVHTPEHIDWAINVWMTSSYAAVSLVLIWNLVAAFLGPQELTRGWRRQLMKKQERTLASRR